jgi:hypothetical protein
VVATATPINDRLTLHTKLAPYRTYAIAAPIEPGAIPDVLVWDTTDPYHYVRLAEHGGETFVIIGGKITRPANRTSEPPWRAWKRGLSPIIRSAGSRSAGRARSWKRWTDWPISA